jgi:hypothetical protein
MLKNRNTAILAVPACGRPDRFYEAVETTTPHHRRDAHVPASVFPQAPNTVARGAGKNRRLAATGGLRGEIISKTTNHGVIAGAFAEGTGVD